MKKTIFLFSIFALISTSCSLTNPTTRAQNLIQKSKFEEALKILENEYKLKPDSVPIKSILAQAYSDYGLALCQDQSKTPKIKYNLAKEQFAMALALNPYQKDAKDMYEMVEKIQTSFAANKIE